MIAFFLQPKAQCQRVTALVSSALFITSCISSAPCPCACVATSGSRGRVAVYTAQGIPVSSIALHVAANQTDAVRCSPWPVIGFSPRVFGCANMIVSHSAQFHSSHFPSRQRYFCCRSPLWCSVLFSLIRMGPKVKVVFFVVILTFRHIFRVILAFKKVARSRFCVWYTCFWVKAIFHIFLLLWMFRIKGWYHHRYVC